MRTVFLHGLLAALCATAAAMVYNYAFNTAMWTDFSKVINPVSMAAGCVLGCTVISLGYFLFGKMVKKGTDIWFNVLLIVLTFATFVGPFSYTLPLDVEFPELFTGLTIPMHMMPALFWLATKPVFYPS